MELNLPELFYMINKVNSIKYLFTKCSEPRKSFTAGISKRN